jgi:hypothetical protein
MLSAAKHIEGPDSHGGVGVILLCDVFPATVGGWQWRGGCGKLVLICAVKKCAFFGAKMGGFDRELAEFGSIWWIFGDFFL